MSPVSENCQFDQKPYIIFRADASGQTGFGHFVRSCALAGYLRRSFQCEIYSWNADRTPPSAWMLGQCAEVNARFIQLQGGNRQEADRSFLEILGARSDYPAVVLDNYYFETEYQSSVRNRARALVCLDDMHDRHFVADLLISFCPAPIERFSTEYYTRILTGFRWAALRAPFLKACPKSNRLFSRTENQIVIAMGGADPLRLTNRLIPMLRKKINDVIIHVIAGDTVHLDSNIDHQARTIVHRRLNASEISDLFDRCDLGVFPASTVCLEAFARNLPVAAGFYADNQLDFYECACAQGLVIPLGDLRTSDLSPLDSISLSGLRMPTPPDFNEASRELRSIFRQLRKS